MIARYLDKGKMYVLDDNGIKCQCVVTNEGNGVLEIKNIATVPEYQGKGYAKAMIDFIIAKYREDYSVLQVGTGDSRQRYPFMRNVVLCVLTLFLISLQKTIIIRYTRMVFNWWIWCT